MATSKNALKSPHLACISIGYVTLLVPADVGIKVVQMLQGAVECRTGVDRSGRTYEPGDQVEVEYFAVRPAQIRFPTPLAPTPVPSVTHTPLRLGNSDA